jgi:hypothetical protein
MDTSKAIEYTDVVGLHAIGPDATEADLADYCAAAEGWLTEHEGDMLSISVRPQRRGEVDGLFRGETPARHCYDQDEVEHVRSLIGQAWDAWCSGEIGHASGLEARR